MEVFENKEVKKYFEHLCVLSGQKQEELNSCRISVVKAFCKWLFVKSRLRWITSEQLLKMYVMMTWFFAQPVGCKEQGKILFSKS